MKLKPSFVNVFVTSAARLTSKPYTVVTGNHKHLYLYLKTLYEGRSQLLSDQSASVDLVFGARLGISVTSLIF